MKIQLTFCDLSDHEAAHLLQASATMDGAVKLEFGHGFKLGDKVSLNDGEPAEILSVHPVAEAAPANPTRRRSRVTETSSSAMLNGTEKNTSEIAKTETSDPTETSSRRRRGGSVSETSSPSEAVTELKAISDGLSGRRRRVSEGSESAENPTRRAGGRSQETDTPKPATINDGSASTALVAGRRRRTETSATTASATTTPASDDKITDADLAVAASQAAQKITPKAVMDIMEEFGVGKVNELKPKQRREFLDQLKDKMKPGN